MRKKDENGESSGKIDELFSGANSLERFRNLNRRSFQSLTGREVEIVFLVALGMNNSEISDKLKILPEEVKNSRVEIQNKLSVHNRADYIKYAFAFGLISFWGTKKLMANHLLHLRYKLMKRDSRPFNKLWSEPVQGSKWRYFPQSYTPGTAGVTTIGRWLKQPSQTVKHSAEKIPNLNHVLMLAVVLFVFAMQRSGRIFNKKNNYEDMWRH